MCVDEFRCERRAFLVRSRCDEHRLNNRDKKGSGSSSSSSSRGTLTRRHFPLATLMRVRTRIKENAIPCIGTGGGHPRCIILRFPCDSIDARHPPSLFVIDNVSSESSRESFCNFYRIFSRNFSRCRKNYNSIFH